MAWTYDNKEVHEWSHGWMFLLPCTGDKVDKSVSEQATKNHDMHAYKGCVNIQTLKIIFYIPGFPCVYALNNMIYSHIVLSHLTFLSIDLNQKRVRYISYWNLQFLNNVTII